MDLMDRSTILITADNNEAFINRTNADVSSTAGMIRTEFGATSVMLIARDGERGIPGAVVTNGSISQRARFSDTDILASGTTSVSTGATSNVFIGFGARYLDQTFADPDSRITGSQGINERFILRDVSVSPSWKTSSSTIDNTVTADLGFVDLRGGSLQPDVGDYVVRRNVGGSYRFQWQANTDLEIDAALRGDWYSDAGSAASGFVGAAYRTSNVVTLRANVGTGFRPPSFNELYFLNYGTSDLEPERSLSATDRSRCFSVELVALGSVGVRRAALTT